MCQLGLLDIGQSMKGTTSPLPSPFPFFPPSFFLETMIVGRVSEIFGILQARLALASL